MKLIELFENISILQQMMLNILEPMAASGVESITVEELVDMMIVNNSSGLMIDRPAIMAVLQPSDNGLVKSIEGDTIYFGKTIEPIRKISDKQSEKEGEKIDKLAAKAATNAIKIDSFPKMNPASVHQNTDKLLKL